MAEEASPWESDFVPDCVYVLVKIIMSIKNYKKYMLKTIIEKI